MRLRIIFILVLFFYPLAHIFAQQAKFTLNGKLVDSASNEPIAFATVSVYKVQDSTLVSYRLSDEKGDYKIPGLPNAIELRVVVTYVGHRTERRRLSNNELKEIDLGIIKMVPQGFMMKEVEIRAEIPPVVVRNDTIEFNASAFKTLPDALVEDLLRKLPGVSVDRNGNIMVNGKRVSKLFVDGKDFFGGNVRTATRNLPANIIDKVQVSNDEDILRINPMLSDIDIPQIINLKLKPGIKKGIFGKVYAGAGPNERFETGAILNLFRDTTQISLIEYGNNLNKSGFGYEDISNVGGFERSGESTSNTTANGGIEINDISFGATGQGIQISRGGGINFNTEVAKDNSLNLQYFYGKISAQVDEFSLVSQTLGADLLNSINTKSIQNGLGSHNFGGHYTVPIIRRGFISFRPNFSFISNESNGLINTSTVSEVEGLKNNGNNDQKLLNNSFKYASTFSVQYNFKKKGRSLYFYNSLNIRNNDKNQFNKATSYFYNPIAENGIDQLRAFNSDDFSTRNSLRLFEPIGENLSFTSTIDVSYFNGSNALGTFKIAPDGKYSILEPTLSERIERTGWKSSFSNGIRWKFGKVTITPAINLSYLTIKNGFESELPIHQRYFYFQPSFSANYKIFYLSYNVFFEEPPASYLQPVVDNTDPLYIQRGNPNLRPTIKHYASLRGRKYDTKRFLTYNADITLNFENSSLILQREVNEDGVQSTTPVNIDGVYTLNNSLSFQKDVKFSENSQISLITSNSFSYKKSFIVLNEEKSKFRVISVVPAAEFRLNLNDVFEYNQVFSFTYYHSGYQSENFNSRSAFFHELRSELIFRKLKSFVFETNLDYKYNSNAAASLNKAFLNWNAGISYIFLKGQKGQLKLSINNILERNADYQNLVTENYIRQEQTNTLGRYGTLTFTYNIRDFGGKVGGRNQLLRF